MKFLLQRVSHATLSLPEIGERRTIGQGLVVYVGISKDDQDISPIRIARMVDKLVQLRIFDDASGRIKNSLLDIQGALLLVSNFTLWGSTKKGSQIDFGRAAGFQEAKAMYDLLVQELRTRKISLQTGEFGAYMEIESLADGPVNIITDG